MVIQYRTFSPENIYTRNIIQINQVVFRNKYVYEKLMKKEAMILKESKDVCVGIFGRNNRRGK